MYPNNNPQSLLTQLTANLQTKRKIFVSYHHRDQYAVDSFRSTFSTVYEVFSDNSLDRLIDSTDTIYVNRAISERYITGTSVTIVICGADTWRRKYVDWEIHSTLEKNHALLGIMLPGIPQVWQNGSYRWIVPPHLHANIEGGYAHFIAWPQTAQNLTTAINDSIYRSTQFKILKNNSEPKMGRNR